MTSFILNLKAMKNYQETRFIEISLKNNYLVFKKKL